MLANRFRYSVLFGQSPSNTKTQNKVLAEGEEYVGPGSFFSRRIVRMVRLENLDEGM